MGKVTTRPVLPLYWMQVQKVSQRLRIIYWRRKWVLRDFGSSLLGWHQFYYLHSQDLDKYTYFSFGPTIEPFKSDQCFLPMDPKELAANAWSKDVPLIIGGCSDEALLLYNREYTADNQVAWNASTFYYWNSICSTQNWRSGPKICSKWIWRTQCHSKNSESIQTAWNASSWAKRWGNTILGIRRFQREHFGRTWRFVYLNPLNERTTSMFVRISAAERQIIRSSDAPCRSQSGRQQ